MASSLKPLQCIYWLRYLMDKWCVEIPRVAMKAEIKPIGFGGFLRSLWSISVHSTRPPSLVVIQRACAPDHLWDQDPPNFLGIDHHISIMFLSFIHVKRPDFPGDPLTPEKLGRTVHGVFLLLKAWSRGVRKRICPAGRGSRHHTLIAWP